MKTYIQFTKITILTLSFLFGAGIVSAQIWQGPTQAPTGGNVSTPLNTSNTGQIKEAGLLLGNSSVTYGLRVINGLIGLGTTTPTEKLDVLGNIRASGKITAGATGFCLPGVAPTGGCITTWPSGGASQWTTSDTHIYNNNSGNIAIGSNSASPNYRLKLSGEMYIDAQNSQGNGGVYIDLPNTSGQNGEVAMTLNSRSTAATKVAILSNKQNFEFRDNSNPPGVRANLLANQVTLSGGSPGNGKILTSDANGVGSWKTPDADPQGSASTNLIPGRETDTPSAPVINLNCPAGQVLTGIKLHDWNSGTKSSMRVAGIYCKDIGVVLQ